MASRAIGDLSPAMLIIYNRHMGLCSRDTELLRRGVTVLTTCTYRSNTEQARLYSQGRDPNVPGPIVTRAKAGQSKHNCVNAAGQPAAEAYDLAPLVSGKIMWDDHAAWAIIGAHGKTAGAKWYGEPGAPFKELPHFELMKGNGYGT